MNYLIEYQKQLGLVPDGRIGPKSAAAMMADLGIKDKLVFAHLMAQSQHESQGFTRFRENLSYSATGLANTWARFSSTGKTGGPPNRLASQFARRPEALANYIYGNRLGNGNEASGDGWRYRGGLSIQTTGKTNWLRFFAFAGLPPDTSPDSLTDNPHLFFLGGKFWFEDNKADKLCTTSDESCVLDLSRKVNLGTAETEKMPIGWEDRLDGARIIFKAIGLA